MTVTEFPRHSNDQAPPGYVTSMELIQRAGITYRQLDYWTRTGLLTPVRTGTPGSGYSRFYPLEQLHRADTLRWLLNGGLSLQMIRHTLDELLETGRVQLTDGLVIHLPDDP
jgi:DNA-binding transcriptional MerR regulator